MGAFTSKLGLYLPGGGSTGQITPPEVVDIDKLNENFRIIDANVGAEIINDISEYVATYDGRLVYTRNDKRLYFVDAGALQQPVFPKDLGANAYVGTEAERRIFGGGGGNPVKAVAGDIWVDNNSTRMVWRYDPSLLALYGTPWISVRSWTKKGSWNPAGTLDWGTTIGHEFVFPDPLYPFVASSPPQVTLQNPSASPFLIAEVTAVTNIAVGVIYKNPVLNPSGAVPAKPNLPTLSYLATGNVIDAAAMA